MIILEKDYSPRFRENNCFLRQFPCKGSWSAESLRWFSKRRRGAQKPVSAAQVPHSYPGRGLQHLCWFGGWRWGWCWGPFGNAQHECQLWDCGDPMAITEFSYLGMLQLSLGALSEHVQRTSLFFSWTRQALRSTVQSTTQEDPAQEDHSPEN